MLSQPQYSAQHRCKSKINDLDMFFGTLLQKHVLQREYQQCSALSVQKWKPAYLYFSQGLQDDL